MLPTSNFLYKQSIAAMLLSRGRLTYTQLKILVPLHPILIRNSLIILIQHNCVVHSDLSEDPNTENRPLLYEVHFEADPVEIMNRTRLGLILNQISETHDEFATEIAKMLIADGKMSIGDLIKRLVRKGKCKFFYLSHQCNHSNLNE